MRVVPLLLIWICCAACYAQRSDDCRECPPPGAANTRDQKVDVIFRDGPPLRNCLSAKRTFVTAFGVEEQGLVLTYATASGCADTTVRIQDVKAFSMSGIGIGGQPFITPVYLAREFYRESGVKEEGGNFFEITALAGYGGKDTSAREVGFNSIYFGAEALISVLELTKNVRLALGGGITVENGRTRFPLQGHIRWNLAGDESLEDSREFVPGPCSFRLPDQPPGAGPGSEYVETTTTGTRDSTVYLVREKKLVSDGFRPFLFVEGGLILSAGFDGAGRNPSVNPDEYGEYFLGGGAGLPIADFLTLSLAYRYLRLNLRTPCPACPPELTGNPDNFFIQNTNRVHSVLLKFGVKVW